MHADIQRSWVIAGLLGLSLGAVLFFLPVGTVRLGDEQNQALWDALSEANTHLEARVEARTAELRKLGVRLVHVQEEERSRLSRDLHDELGQTLTGLRLRLTALSVIVENNENATAQLTEALKAIDAGVDQVRGLHIT